MKMIKFMLGAFSFYIRRGNIYFRSRYYKKIYPFIDNSVIIGYETIIDSEKNKIIIGKGTYLQRNCQIVGDVTIGENCSIASNVNIWANTHDKKRNSLDKVKKGKIIIGNNVWIGSNCFIRENIKIGNNCILGANSVITKNVPNNQIVGGVPARKIGLVK